MSPFTTAVVAAALAILALFVAQRSSAASITFGMEAKEVLLPNGIRSSDGGSVEPSTFIFAAGCFWGPELAFQRIPGVLKTEVGYAGGHVAQPSYEQVCAGGTGHREAVRVVYDANVVSLERLLVVYWDVLKDPSDAGGQGYDRGESYTLALFAQSEEERRLFESFLAEKQQSMKEENAVEVLDMKNFYTAENYHQQYLQKHGQSAAKSDLTPIRCYG